MPPTSCFFGTRFVKYLSVLLAGALLFEEKNPPKCWEVLQYFGLDCGMLEFFKCFT
jgi:hypothetical protein